MSEIDCGMGVRLQQNGAQAEIDNQAAHVHKRCDEGSRSARRVEATPAQDERQHRAGNRAEGHDADEDEPDLNEQFLGQTGTTR